MIYLFWASVRPEMFKATHKHWMDNAKYPDRVISKVVVSTEEQKEQLRGYDVLVEPQLGYTYGIYQLTKDFEANDKDLILFPSDDVYAPKLWDNYLIHKFNFWEGAVFLDDGIQNKIRDHNGQPIMPLEYLAIFAITFKCLKKLGKCAFSTNYYHCFSDAELYYNLYHMRELIDDRVKDGVIFEHKHFSNGTREWDSVDEKNYGQGNKRMLKDQDTFFRRMEMSLPDRLSTLVAPFYTKTNNRMIATSGNFDPFHAGHLECLKRAKAIGDKLIVFVDSDRRVMEKKGFVFMNENDRLGIIRAIKYVDEAYIVDTSIADALVKFGDIVDVFAKGGDRTIATLPKEEVMACTKHNITIIDELGDKIQASSDLLENYFQHRINKNIAKAKSQK